jgi:hypothetical protein
MTLNDWSLVVFAITAAYYLTIYFSLFRSPSLGKFLILILMWIAHTAVLAVYGISTGQVGFIFIAGLEVVMVLLVYVIVGKLVSTNDS